MLDLRDARASLDGLEIDPAFAASAIATWRGRMVNEHGSARVFEGLAEQMHAAGIEPRWIDEVRTFADEERRHGALCAAVVNALGGDAYAPALPEQPFPLHADASSPLEAVLRNVLSIACLSETVAVALIGKEREEMPASALRELLTRIWADEIGHARFGWRFVHAHVSALDEASRRGLCAYLRVALDHLEEHELAHLPIAATPAAGGERYGLCSGAEARALFYDTVQKVIEPALAQLGLTAGDEASVALATAVRAGPVELELVALQDEAVLLRDQLL